MTLFHHQTGRLRTWVRRVIWSIVVVGALGAIVIPIFLIYRHEGDNTRAMVEVGPQGVSHTGDYIHVVGSVASVDFENKNYRVHFEFTPHGTLAGDDGVLSAAITVSLFYTTLIFPESQIMRSVDVTMPYMQGATIDYPFDAYKSYFEILANKEFEQLHRIPVSLTFLGLLQTVEFVPVVHLDPMDTYKISVEIFTRRSPTTIGFSLFIVLIMWALSIAIGIIAIQVIRKHRMAGEHILTLGITTLFALPALRETQPGIPAIGCAADVLGFYWNMAIIAISSIMILMASALRWKEPSIEEEIKLVHEQHDFQSKLISEMAIPMPFPITGGPFYKYQVKKKRMPFMMSKDHLPRSPKPSSVTGSPLYSEGGHEYHHSSRDGYFYRVEDDQPEILLDGEFKEHIHHLQQRNDSELYMSQSRTSSPQSTATTTSLSSSSLSQHPRSRVGAGVGVMHRRQADEDFGLESLFTGSMASITLSRTDTSSTDSGNGGKKSAHVPESSASQSRNKSSVEKGHSLPCSSSSPSSPEQDTISPRHHQHSLDGHPYTGPRTQRQIPIQQLHQPIRAKQGNTASLTVPTSLAERGRESLPRYRADWNSSTTLPSTSEGQLKTIAVAEQRQDQQHSKHQTPRPKPRESLLEPDKASSSHHLPAGHVIQRTERQQWYQLPQQGESLAMAPEETDHSSLSSTVSHTLLRI